MQNELYKCEKCSYIIKASIKNHIRSCDGRGPRSIRRKLYPGKKGGWQKGKTFIEIYGEDRAIEIKKKLSNSIKKASRTPMSEKTAKEFSKKVSERMKLQYANGWESRCGRSKKYDYVSKIAGKIKVDGTWELKVASYLDSINVRWSRPVNRFMYIKPDGKESTYKPDFYVEDWDSYIEVKGYKTQLDEYKWSQFPKKLIIWQKNELVSLGILEK